MTGPLGVIYMLHFDQPYRHAKHYVGNPQSSQFLTAIGPFMCRQFGELAGIGSPDWVTRSRNRLVSWAEVADDQRNVRARHHEIDRAGRSLAGHDDESWDRHQSVLGFASFLHAWLTVIGWTGDDRFDRSGDLLRRAADAPERFPPRAVAGEVEPSLSQPGWEGCRRASQEAADPAGLATPHGREVGLASRGRGRLEKPRGVQQHADDAICPGRVPGPLSQGHEHNHSSDPASGARSPRLQEFRNAPVIAEHPSELLTPLRESASDTSAQLPRSPRRPALRRAVRPVHPEPAPLPRLRRAVLRRHRTPAPPRPARAHRTARHHLPRRPAARHRSHLPPGVVAIHRHRAPRRRPPPGLARSQRQLPGPRHRRSPALVGPGPRCDRPARLPAARGPVRRQIRRPGRARRVQRLRPVHPLPDQVPDQADQRLPHG
jgi:hypothetical protein